MRKGRKRTRQLGVYAWCFPIIASLQAFVPEQHSPHRVAYTDAELRPQRLVTMRAGKSQPLNFLFFLAETGTLAIPRLLYERPKGTLRASGCGNSLLRRRGSLYHHDLTRLRLGNLLVDDLLTWLCLGNLLINNLLTWLRLRYLLVDDLLTRLCLGYLLIDDLLRGRGNLRHHHAGAAAINTCLSATLFGRRQTISG